MSRLVARAETWERVYDAFQNVNFAAFDYSTVKRSILDYIKLYFPETFNDFIESSELVAIVEVFAYVAELLAYRVDVNAHENFISTAQRKDSILRLAKLVSYSAARPLPARGLVKLTSVSTTESIIDANGNDLANRVIRWNDVTNSNWKDQFSLVMNRVLDQDFGSVGPTDRFQIQDVLFETYSLNLNALQTGVFTYSANVNGHSVPMELVPVAYDSALGLIERRPQLNSTFSILYGQDGLGDASNTTGFFCFTKQGSLQRYRTSFDGITPNQTYDVNTDNVNDIDVWLNNVNPATGEVLNTQSSLPYRKEALQGKSGEWVQVDLAHAQNVIFNTNPRRNKYEVETRDNNRVRLIFGDGEFADIPSGTFDIWVRTSLDEDILVPQSSVTNVPTTFSYVDSYGRTQTFTFTFSLVGSLQNASASEDMEHVRLTAPAVYYSQDRMVNGEDYNVFPLQDPSILKMRSINRTFAGDSKYIKWHDASGTYENVKIFGDDGILYFEDRDVEIATPVIDLSVLISSYIEPLLSSTDLFLQLSTFGVTPQQFRRTFNQTEVSSIRGALSTVAPAGAKLYYNTNSNTWYAISATADPTDDYPAGLGNIGYRPTQADSTFIVDPLITVNQDGIFETKYKVARVARRLVFQSPTTKFWNTNEANRVVDFTTIRSTSDTITVLQPNLNSDRSGILQSNWVFNVLGQETIESGINLGLIDETRISVLPIDENQDGIPDNINVDASDKKGVADIITPKVIVTSSQIANTGNIITLPISYIVSPTPLSPTEVEWEPKTASIRELGNPGTVSNQIQVSAMGSNSQITVTVRDYVYFTRTSTTDEWVPVPATPTNMVAYATDKATHTLEQDRLWKRQQGRSNLNFAWFHTSPRYYLVDPSPTNLIDMFVVTKGYFTSIKRWLEDPLAPEPDLPTPLDLRTSYGYLLDNKMISDTAIMHPGKFKILFGSRAQPSLQGSFKIVRSADKTLTDNQIKTIVVATIRNFFDVTKWEFGETFFLTELVAAIHAALPTELSSVVLVPVLRENHFGTLFEVIAREDELFYPDISVADIELVTSLNAVNLNIGSGSSTSVTANTSTTSFQLTSDVTEVDEGGVIIVTLKTTNVPDGTVFAYTMSGPGIDAGDFTNGSLTGTFTVVSNKATAQIGIRADLATEGPQSVAMTLDNGAALFEFTINDTSTTPNATYSLSTQIPVVNSLPQINEGSVGQIKLTTTGLPQGTTIGYTVTGITQDDLSVGSLTGVFTLDDNGEATYTFSPSNDQLLEGDEQMVLSLNNGRGSITVRIKDTSTQASGGNTPVLEVTPSTMTITGNVNVASSPVTVMMTNTGGVDLTINTIQVTASNATWQRTGTYQTPITLAPGQTTTFAISFTPTAAGMTTSTLIAITSNGGNFQIPVSISATSVGPQIIQFYADPASVAYGQSTTIYYKVNSDTANTRIYEDAGPGFNFVTTSLGVLRQYTYSPSRAGVIPVGILSSDGTSTATQQIYVTSIAPAPTPAPPPSAPTPVMSFTPITMAVTDGTVSSTLLINGSTSNSRSISSIALVAGSCPLSLSNTATGVYASGYYTSPVVYTGPSSESDGGYGPADATYNFTVRITDNWGTTYDIACVINGTAPPRTEVPAGG